MKDPLFCGYVLRTHCIDSFNVLNDFTTLRAVEKLSILRREENEDNSNIHRYFTLLNGVKEENWIFESHILSNSNISLLALVNRTNHEESSEGCDSLLESVFFAWFKSSASFYAVVFGPSLINCLVRYHKLKINSDLVMISQSVEAISLLGFKSNLSVFIDETAFFISYMHVE